MTREMTWGSPESDSLIQTQSKIFLDLGVYDAYHKRLELRKRKGYTVNTAASHSDFPLLPHAPLVIDEGVVPFPIEQVNTDTGEYLPDTRVSTGIIDISTRGMNIVVLRADEPFNLTQLRALAQCAMAMSERGWSIGGAQRLR